MKTWPGVVKIKMLHRAGATVLLPEVVIVGGAGNQWVQPQFFYAPLLAFADDESSATIWIAALDPNRQHQDGLECQIALRRSDRCATLSDRSEVYRCRVETAFSAAQLAVGRARVRTDGGIDLRLHHHTARETLPLIHDSRHVRGSSWNYQGTRALTNVGYAYFTSMRSVSTEADLLSIAMASRGQIRLRLDTNTSSDPDLLLEVYRASTRDRKATLTLWVPGETISTPHIWQHAGLSVHYEITHPWIYRVGLEPGAHLDFHVDRTTPDPASLKRFDYAVIGDCTTTAGLEAPYDEENTSETFIVEDLAGTNLFDFWRDHANTQLHTPPSVTQTFKPFSAPQARHDGAETPPEGPAAPGWPRRRIGALKPSDRSRRPADRSLCVTCGEPQPVVLTTISIGMAWLRIPKSCGSRSYGPQISHYLTRSRE